MDDNQKFIEKRLENLENSLQRQEEKLDNLEKLINKLVNVPDKVKAENEIKVDKNKLSETLEDTSLGGQEEVQSQTFESSITSQSKNSSFEENFGKKWLSKIGVVLFALGVGFLISYSFKFFGPLLKIICGYIIGVILFFIGKKLEVKENLMNYGRVIMGGAWAIIYFTTYAMYHLPATKIINSQKLDLFLLLIVVFGIMRHVLYYKSEVLMAVAFLVAYLTSTISNITYFTIVSNLFLAILMLFFVYKFQWIKILVFGIVVTYVLHGFWISPKLIQMSGDLFNLVFISCYWLVFLIGIHLIKAQNHQQYSQSLAVINFGNIIIYNVLSYPLVNELFFDRRFDFFFLEGLIYLVLSLMMRSKNNKDLYLSDLSAGVFLATFSISLDFLPNISLVIWMLELPLLLFIGSKFGEKVFRYLSYCLGVYVFFQIINWWFFNHRLWQDYFHLLTAISMGISFAIIQCFKTKNNFNELDRLFDYVFSFLACCFFGFWVNSWVLDSWRASAFYFQALIYFSLSVFSFRFKAYTYMVLVIATFISLFNHLEYESFIPIIISFNVLAFFIIYYALQYLQKSKIKELLIDGEENVLLVASILVLIFNVHSYVYPQWISLVLGLSSVLIILVGFFNENKNERIGGIILLGITLVRVFMVDLSDLNIIFKIITFMVLGCLFLGISYVYNKFKIKSGN